MEKPNIGIVTIPISEAGAVSLSNLANILGSLSDNVRIITAGAGYTLFKGNHKVEPYELEFRPGSNMFTRIIKHVLAQIRISRKIVQASRDIQLWFFSLGGSLLLLPMLSAKLLHKKVVLIFTGSPIENIKAQSKALSVPIQLLVKANLSLSDRIILYSQVSVAQHNLERYRHKISISPEHLLDFDQFNIETPLGERANLIGYIGRLSEEKGILNFMESLPKLLAREADVEILVAGDGRLRSKLEQYLVKEGLSNKVQFVGWIHHDELPRYLNQLKLLILPSHSEGLPNIMLEAIACGTPVLATPVGAIPDLIRDGKTGFILEDNSPDCIASNIVKVLNHPNLNEIAWNAHVLVEQEFTYEAAVEKYRAMLASLNWKR